MKKNRLILATLVVCCITTEKSYCVDQSYIENSNWVRALSQQYPARPVNYSNLEEGFINEKFRKGFLLEIQKIDLSDIDVQGMFIKLCHEQFLTLHSRPYLGSKYQAER